MLGRVSVFQQEGRRSRLVDSGGGMLMGLDVANHGFDGFVKGEIGGVNVDRIRRADERTDRAALVTHVPLNDLVQHILLLDGNALTGQLSDPATSAFFWVGVEIKFEVGLGKNDGALIAPSVTREPCSFPMSLCWRTSSSLTQGLSAAT